MKNNSRNALQKGCRPVECFGRVRVAVKCGDSLWKWLKSCLPTAGAALSQILVVLGPFTWSSAIAKSVTPAEEITIANAYLNGHGVEKDERRALEHFRNAADAGDPLAQDQAANLLVKGAEPSRSRVLAIEAEKKQIQVRLVQREVTKADIDRMIALVEEMRPVRDPAAAVSYLKQSIAAGRSEAARHLANILLAGTAYPRDLEGARSAYALAAGRGDAIAFHMLGVMQELGLGGTIDLVTAEASQRRAAELGEPRARFAVSDSSGADAWTVVAFSLAAVEGLATPRQLQPRRGEGPRRIEVLRPSQVVLRDVLGRRRFNARLDAGEQVRLLAGDADLSITSADTMGPGDRALARLVTGDVVEDIAGKPKATRKLLDASTLPSWIVTKEQGEFRVFTSDNALSLPDRFIALQPDPLDDTPIEVADQEDLYLELRPDSTVDLASPVGNHRFLKSPAQVVLRCRMVVGITNDGPLEVGDADTLPPELGSTVDGGTAVMRDPGGEILCRAFRADDYRQPAVIAPLSFNYSFAASQSLISGDFGQAIRSARIAHAMNLQLYGPNSDDSVYSGMMLSTVLASVGQISQALAEADTWSSVAERLTGPQAEAVVAAHLLRAASEAASGHLPLAEADVLKALSGLLMLTKGLQRVEKAGGADVGALAAQLRGTVDNRYVRCLNVLADLYSAGGEAARERAVLRRLILLDSVSNPEGSGNGSIDLVLRLARLEMVARPDEAGSLAELARAHAKVDAFLRDVPEPLPPTLPDVPPFFRSIFGDPQRSLPYSAALRRLGEAYILLGRASEALPPLDRAALIAANSTAPGDPARTRIAMLQAEAALQLGKHHDALVLAREAFAAAVKYRDEDLGNDSSASLAILANAAAQLLLGLLASEAPHIDNSHEAFAVLTRIMDGDLQQATNLAGQPGPAATAAQLASVRRRLRDAVMKGDAAAMERLRTADADLSARLGSLLRKPGPPGLSDTLAALEPNSTLLLLWPGRIRTFALVVGQNRQMLFQIAGDTEHLKATSEKYRDDLVDTSRPFDGAAATQLFDLLIRPGSDVLPQSGSVFVMSDGFLRAVPLEALRDRDAWLIDEHPIAYVTSLQPPSDPRIAKFGRPPLFAMGNPVVLGAEDSPLRRFLSRLHWRNRVAPLPETEHEMETVRATLNGTRADILSGPRATMTELVANNDFARARVLLFATHGYAGGMPDEPDGLPSLLLSPDPAGQRYLSVAAIEGFRIDADLVVLSACDTAAPDGSLGSAGLSGLARAFIQAGAKAVIATHWEVRSDLAERFSTSVIREWRGGATLLDAKTAAQKQLREGPARDHPGLWAAFALLGDSRVRW